PTRSTCHCCGRSRTLICWSISGGWGWFFTKRRRTEGVMKDIQKTHDTRNIPIDKVGVKDISYPIVVMDRKKKFQHTVARINMYVDLPHHFKGTHMSRFIEILNSYREEIALDKLEI